MKLSVILILLVMFLSSSLELISETSCSARADNGRTCSVGCLTGDIAVCMGGATTPSCTCVPPPPPGGAGGDEGGSFTLTIFAHGERDYFTNQLRPFIQSLNSNEATELVSALDWVIEAVDEQNETEFNLAENNYVVKRAALSGLEIAALDQWVDQNRFYQ